MPTISILEAFSASIPDGERAPQPLQPRGTHTSGSTTAEADPPKLAFEVDYTDAWKPYAKNILGNVDIQRFLDGKRLAAWEETRYFDAEGDVSDAASPQLTNPVDLALCAAHPQTSIKCINQCTEDSARADKVWRFSNGREWKNFAVLDYKRVWTMEPAKIERAFRKPHKFYEDLGRIGDRVTFYDKNFEKILKQAVSYAFIYDTKYVAFFDWDTLVLFYLADQHDNTGGDYVYVTLIIDKREMRRALLAFLERAYLSATRGEETLRYDFGITFPPTPYTKSRSSSRLATQSQAQGYYGRYYVD